MKISNNELNVLYSLVLSTATSPWTDVQVFTKLLSHLLQHLCEREEENRRRENRTLNHNNLDSLSKILKQTISFWLAPLYCIVFFPLRTNHEAKGYDLATNPEPSFMCTVTVNNFCNRLITSNMMRSSDNGGIIITEISRNEPGRT